MLLYVFFFYKVLVVFCRHKFKLSIVTCRVLVPTFLSNWYAACSIIYKTLRTSASMTRVHSL